VRDDDWIGTWTASPSDANPSGFTDQTLRLIVHTSIGGREVRVRLSNAYGAQPLTVGAAQIAVQKRRRLDRRRQQPPLTSAASPPR
jgi:hypothetical protein